MNEQPLDIPRLVELAGAMCDGVIDRDAAEELDAMLAGSQEARRIYGLVVDTHLDLEADGVGAVAEPIIVGHVGPARASQPSQPWRSYAVAAGIAIAAVLAVVVGMALSGAGEAEPELPAWPVAVLINSEGVTWSSEPVDIGQDVRPGALRIERGRIEIAMHSGATVTAIGPVDLVVRSKSRCDLLRGQLTANVPERAIGFTVATPRFTVVDLGTEFGVRVGTGGAGEVRVFNGSVAVDDGDRTIVQAGHGRRYASSGSAVDFVVVDRWRDDPVRFVHYRFDESAGEPFVDSGSGFESGPFHIEPKLSGQSPRRIEGVFGQAIEIDPGQVLDTGFAGIAGGSERTVAFWLRLPTDAKSGQSQAVLSWGDHQTQGGAWQIGWDRWHEHNMGSVRLFAGDRGVIAGSTDLRDGAWHHVAVVLEASDEPDVSANVKLYIDGELETVGRSTPAGVDTQIGEGAAPMRIGWGLRENRGAFRGAIDELVVTDAALTAEGIEKLMKTNSPAP